MLILYLKGKLSQLVAAVLLLHNLMIQQGSMVKEQIMQQIRAGQILCMEHNCSTFGQFAFVVIGKVATKHLVL